MEPVVERLTQQRRVARDAIAAPSIAAAPAVDDRVAVADARTEARLAKRAVFVRVSGMTTHRHERQHRRRLASRAARRFGSTRRRRRRRARRRGCRRAPRAAPPPRAGSARIGLPAGGRGAGDQPERDRRGARSEPALERDAVAKREAEALERGEELECAEREMHCGRAEPRRRPRRSISTANVVGTPRPPARSRDRARRRPRRSPGRGSRSMAGASARIIRPPRARRRASARPSATRPRRPRPRPSARAP